MYILSEGAGEPIAWAIRMKIAIGAARGLAFLHTTEKQVIYRDFKASNILLDGVITSKFPIINLIDYQNHSLRFNYFQHSTN